MTGNAAPVQAGDVLAGKYRVDRVLGRGGMGVVVAAIHLQLEQTVALKFMLPQVLGNPEAVERFNREARAAARLRSEHVARIIDVGVLDGGSPYIVMEYLEGTDLASLLSHGGALSATQVADYVVQALDGVAEAHSIGIVHRDLKPGNLFLTRRADGSPLVKVLDFGISKTGPMAADTALTGTQAVIGSPKYMSPEHMRASRMVDARSDIWSLGVILYELVSGQVPFSADAFSALVLQVAIDPPPPLAPPVPLPEGFESIVWRCLMKDPVLRFQNVAELAAALAPFAPSTVWPLVDRIRNLCRGPMTVSPAVTQPMTPTPAAVSARVVALPASSELTQSSSHTLWSTRTMSRRSRRTAGIAVVVVLAAVVGTLLAVLRDREDRSEAEDKGPAAAAPAPSPASEAPTSAPAEETRDSAATVSGSAPDRAPKSPPRRRGNRPRRTVKQTGHPEPDDPLATPE